MRWLSIILLIVIGVAGVVAMQLWFWTFIPFIILFSAAGLMFAREKRE
jgi:hypothetical protein